jgi:hypothetical protein
MMQLEMLEMGDPVRSQEGRVEWSIRTEKDGVGVVTDVGVDADAAREWALKLLTAAGPNTAELVRSWVAGEVRVTIEAPAGREDVLDPLLSSSPATTEDFEAVLAVFGGLAAFSDFNPYATYAQLHLMVPALGGEGAPLSVSVKPPPSITRVEPQIPTGLWELQRRQQEAKAQVVDEQDAADRLARELGPGPGRDHVDD